MYIYRARVATIMDKGESTADLRKKEMNEKVSKFEIQGKRKIYLSGKYLDCLLRWLAFLSFYI